MGKWYNTVYCQDPIFQISNYHLGMSWGYHHMWIYIHDSRGVRAYFVAGKECFLWRSTPSRTLKLVVLCEHSNCGTAHLHSLFGCWRYFWVYQEFKAMKPAWEFDRPSSLLAFVLQKSLCAFMKSAEIADIRDIWVDLGWSWYTMITPLIWVSTQIFLQGAEGTMVKSTMGAKSQADGLPVTSSGDLPTRVDEWLVLAWLMIHQQAAFFFRLPMRSHECRWIWYVQLEEHCLASKMTLSIHMALSIPRGHTGMKDRVAWNGWRKAIAHCDSLRVPSPLIMNNLTMESQYQKFHPETQVACWGRWLLSNSAATLGRLEVRHTSLGTSPLARPNWRTPPNVSQRCEDLRRISLVEIWICFN